MEAHFDQLWHTFSKELGKYIQSKVNNRHDAEDILQDVYVKIFRNLDKVEKKTAIRSWLYTITKNTIIDFYKKKKDHLVTPERILEIEDAFTEESFDDGNMNKEVADCLDQMIFDIPDKYREVCDLYERKNLKHSEIADKLGISTSASKVRLSRAKAKIKENILKCCDLELDAYGNIIDYTSKCEEDPVNHVKKVS